MKAYLIILLFILVDNIVIIDITPFTEMEIDYVIEKSSTAYFKINLKNVNDEDKQNLYIQYKKMIKTYGYCLNVDACSFSNEPSESDLLAFTNSIKNIPGDSHSDSYFTYYNFRVPKFEKSNWLIIRATNADDYGVRIISFYIYSNKDKSNDKQNLSWNIAITVISATNTLLIIFILFKILTFKNHFSIDTLNNNKLV